ncbi:MAG: calcium-binding protein [Cyanothece sp. SIO2G6]|nr:calcium-binding protein [Cyanothece sp. SIO2G6]
MARIERDPEREERITMEAIVDCYDEYEVAAGWYCYIEDKLNTPFTATWVSKNPGKSKTVQVVGMASSDECERELMVEIELDDGIFSVPLSMIEPATDTDPETQQVIADWQYWIGQGNEFEVYAEDD